MTPELQARLAAAREAKAAAAAKVEPPKTEEEEALAEVERAELEAKEEEALADAVAQHGPFGKKIGYVDTVRNGRVIIKRPHHLVYRKYVAVAGGDDMAKTIVETEKFVLPLVVYPDAAKVAGIFEDEPAALFTCAKVAGDLCGGGKGVVEGK